MDQHLPSVSRNKHDVDYFSFINESTTAPIMQMQHQSQERFESHLENLWNRDPYLNHVKQTEAEMLRSIERRNEERPPPLPLPLAMNENIKWTTIVSRCRKPSLNADENPSHRSSQVGLRHAFISSSNSTSNAI